MKFKSEMTVEEELVAHDRVWARLSSSDSTRWIKDDAPIRAAHEIIKLREKVKVLEEQLSNKGWELDNRYRERVHHGVDW